MPSKNFTDKLVAKFRLKSGERQQVYFDQRKSALFWSSERRAKTWRLLAYKNGKGTTSKLGRYPDLSLKDARQKARDFADDPRKFAAQSKPDSVKDEATKWFKRCVENRLRSASEIERILE